MSQPEDPQTMSTPAFSVVDSLVKSSHSNVNFQAPMSTTNLGPFPFPKPEIGHICTRCQGIPLAILLVGSRFFSKRCKGKHEEGRNCKGKHQITCDHCREHIQDAHYHCGLCNDENFDVCAACKLNGKHCQMQEHELTKRIFDEGLIREVADDDDSYHHPGVTRALLEEGMEPYRLHNTLSDMLISAEAGCHSCSVLVGWLDEDIEKTPKDMPVFIENRPLRVPDDARYVKFLSNKMALEPDLDDEADEGLPVTVLAVRGERDPENPVFEDPERDRITRLIPFEMRGPNKVSCSRHADWITANERRQISPVIDAGNNLKVIGSWLRSCLDGDSDCSAWPKEPFKPTRLIYVGSTDSEDDPLRLVRGSDIEEPFAGYVTLSYCWGTTGQHTRWILTKERMGMFEHAIPADTLPKTIADAISVARANAIHYLWVDSLCIAQDDASDWAYEAYRMGQVYKSSLFTIISGTDSATGGLFLPREQLKVSAAEISVGSDSDPKTHLAVVYPLLKDIGTKHRGGPTSKRAWCYQEELLSPRRLYFTDAQFTWECLCSTHDETGKRSPGDTKSTGYASPPYDADVLFRGSRVIGEWYSVLEEYTSRQFTFHGDIFAALAGIAASFKAKYQCKYLAGMWEDDMVKGLIWQRVGSSLARPADFDAPSWSWLSVEGHVMFAHGDQTPSNADAEYVDCDIKTKGDDEFSAVLPGGTLRLRARLLPCEIAPEIKEQEFEKLENVHQPLPRKITPVKKRGGTTSDGSGGDGETDSENQDEDGDEDSDEHSDENEDEDKPAYFLRSGPWELSNRLPISPPGNRIDMTARVKLQGKPNEREFATIFFDGEAEAQTTEFLVAYMAATHRPEETIDRNGIALVPMTNSNEPGSRDGKMYRRIGFVAFWDKLIKDDLAFLEEVEKTEILLV